MKHMYFWAACHQIHQWKPLWHETLWKYQCNMLLATGSHYPSGCWIPSSCTIRPWGHTTLSLTSTVLKCQKALLHQGRWWGGGVGVECFMAFTCHGEGQKLLDSLSQLGGKVFYEEIKKEKSHFFFWEFVFCFAFLSFVSYSPVMRHKETSKCEICLEYWWVAVNEHLVGKVLNWCYGQRSGA